MDSVLVVSVVSRRICWKHAGDWSKDGPDDATYWESVGSVWQEISSIIPFGTRTTNYFYAYYALKTLTAMICEGSVSCLALAYLVDNIADGQRASAFGILSGITSGISLIILCNLQSAAFLVVESRLYSMTQPILKGSEDVVQKDGNVVPRKMPAFKRIPSLGDIICLLRSSPSFTQAAIVAFFYNLAEAQNFVTLQYYLKARFHFNKNQFADLMLLAGIIAAASQLCIMPLLVSPIGVGKLLSIGLLVSCIHAIIYSMAWSPWVPYATTALSAVMVFAPPSLLSIVSKQVGSAEQVTGSPCFESFSSWMNLTVKPWYYNQGKAQGCISGVSSLANIIAPLIFSPLTGF
ncbi:Major facilitator superfamily protein, putative isoform 2 [Hibiscus syriacus]|uniref:Major facilitator superfamily protein, putative isoform 2 n=1 Tax=Hibiscus syriacus TaxID=106335 RepID=A0A6A2X1M9_HIBSY|nr:Major facilitator superfamily protein, putative isoform 2 [Hibiscus syriacus]